MSEGRDIRCYDYVNHPYEQVAEALRRDAVAVFHGATQAAASRAGDVAAELHVNIGGIDISTEIDISVTGVTYEPGTVTAPPATRLQLEWEATRKPRLFPIMKAELAAYRLTASETQLDFSGAYEPPLGALGEAMDLAVSHRLAEASVHRFLADVAAYLKKELSWRTITVGRESPGPCPRTGPATRTPRNSRCPPGLPPDSAVAPPSACSTDSHC